MILGLLKKFPQNQNTQERKKERKKLDIKNITTNSPNPNKQTQNNSKPKNK
jgi:hypothetical protein